MRNASRQRAAAKREGGNGIGHERGGGQDGRGDAIGRMKASEHLETPRAESVTEFTRRVKMLLESAVRPGWVRGEVSNLRAQASGHVYFSLKDAGAQVSCVLFRGDAQRQDVALRDGLQVLVLGEVSVYEQRGQYQLIVRVVVDDGAEPPWWTAPPRWWSVPRPPR